MSNGFMAAFKSVKKISNPKSERLCSLWARGSALSSGSTVEGKTFVLTPASDDGEVWELKTGSETNLEVAACKKSMGTFSAPKAGKDSVQTQFDGELFTSHIMRGTIKVDGKTVEATAFLSSKEEIEAKAAKKGIDPGKYPIGYILYQEPLKKKS